MYEMSGSDLVSVMGLDEESGPIAIFSSKMEEQTSRPNLRKAALASLVISLYKERTRRMVVQARPYQNEWRTAVVDGIVVSEHPKPAWNPPGLEPATLTHNSPDIWADILLAIATPTSRTLHLWGPESDFPINPRRPAPVPIRSVVECVWNMHVTGIHKCDLAVLLDDELRVYGIEYDLFFADAIESAASSFIKAHLDTKTPPQPDYRPISQEVLLKMFPGPKVSLMIAPTPETVALARELQNTKIFLRQHGLLADELTNKLCAAIGDAEGIQELCTWKKVEGKVDWEKVARSCITPSQVESLCEKYRNDGIRRFRLLGDPNEQ